MNLFRRLLRIMVSLLVVATLSACSALKLGYNTLPEVGYWWLDGFADFTDEQAPRVRDELARLQAWHRGTELARIADLLGRLEQAAAGPVTAAQACGVVVEAQARLMAVVDQAEPAAVALGATFTPRQFRHIERRFGKKNAEWRSEWMDLPVAERLEKRQKQWADRLETLYGPLEDAQRAVLRRAMSQSVWDPARHLVEWQRRQSDLLQVMPQLRENAGDPAKLRALARGWTERVLRSPESGYRAYQQALQEENCRTFAAVHESTNAEQRARAARRLKAWQRDLRELAGGQ